MSDLPPLPSGFTMEGDASALPALPNGFVPEQQHKFGLADTWPVQLAKSIYGAVTLPGDVYQGKAAVPSSENDAANIDRVTNLAGITLPDALPVSKTATIPAAIPTAPELKAAATAGYDAAKASGVELKPSSIANFTAKVKSDLNNDGVNEILAPKTFGIIDKMGAPPEGATVTTNDFRTMQRALGHAARSPDPTEKMAASRALQALTDHVENIPASDISKGTPEQLANVVSTIKDANANYAAYKRGETVSGRIDAAQLNAMSANSGANIDNAMRQQIKAILKSPKLRLGYSANELEQMRKIVGGTSVSNIVRMAGNLLGGGGGLGAVASSAAGAYATGGPGIIAPVLGFGMKKLGNQMTAGKVAQLESMIRARSPLAQSRNPTSITYENPIAALIASGQLTLPQILGLRTGGVPLRADQQQ